jgi:hypothetical protein
MRLPALTKGGQRYADSFNRWWDDLGHPYLGHETVDRLVEGLAPITGTESVDDLTERRSDFTQSLSRRRANAS